MKVAVAIFTLLLSLGASRSELPGQVPVRDSTDAVTWEARAVCPYSCRRCGGASDGTYFYVLGGWDGVNTRAYNYRYNPSSDSWTQRQSMPTGVSNAGVCYSPQHNAIFVLGGLVQSGDSVTLVQRYDIASNSWTSNTTLPYQDYGIAAVALGDHVYVLFGSGHPGRFWRYHPQTNAWVELAQCTGATSHAALCTRGGLIYASGGWTQNSMFKCYDPTDNSWRNLPSLPQARHGHGMDTVGAKVYVYGGGRTWGATQDCWSYDPTDSTWTNEGNMLQPHIGGAFAAVATGGVTRLHAACGYYATDRHERGTPASTDVGVVAVVAPVGTIDTLQPVAPACSVANHGSDSVSFRVRCRVGTFYLDTAQVSSLAPGARKEVTFSARTNWPRGTHTVTCSTELAGDASPTNDSMTGSVRVNVRDVGTQTISAPSGILDSGTTVFPACSLDNHGTTIETYRVCLRIGTTYTNTSTVADHTPGRRVAVTFPAWQASERGRVPVSCSTELSGDACPANDRLASTVDVRVVDVALQGVSSPLAWEKAGDIPVEVRLTNRGTTEAQNLLVKTIIRDSTEPEVYQDSATVAALLPGDWTEVGLSPWLAGEGVYRLTARVSIADDMNPGNDSLTMIVTVTASGIGTWHERRSMPGPPSFKEVKDGAWLAYLESTGRIYAAKGNKTTDFYEYSPAADSWTPLAPIPLGRENKPPSKGAAACASGSSRLYVTKGNNTSGFYFYDVRADSWHQLADIPLGTTNTRVKGGTDLVFVAGSGPEGDRVYLLKGNRNEFWCYRPAVDSWTELAPAPAAKWGKGSWLVDVPDGGQNSKSRGIEGSDGNPGLGPLDSRPPGSFSGGIILAHQAKYHGFYAFDLRSGSWGPALTPMPMVGRAGRAKKSKDGGCATWMAGVVFALKGGNTQEFWCYEPQRDSWTELDTLPVLGRSGKRKRVKGGADITAASGALFALKGNKTFELWQYIPSSAQTQSRLASPLSSHSSILNPHLSGASRSSLIASRSLPVLLHPSLITHNSSPVSVYAPSGLKVLSTTAVGLTLDAAQHLRPGVYFLRTASGPLAQTHKLVVVR